VYTNAVPRCRFLLVLIEQILVRVKRDRRYASNIFNYLSWSLAVCYVCSLDILCKHNVNIHFLQLDTVSHPVSYPNSTRIVRMYDRSCPLEDLSHDYVSFFPGMEVQSVLEPLWRTSRCESVVNLSNNQHIQTLLISGFFFSLFFFQNCSAHLVDTTLNFVNVQDRCTQKTTCLLLSFLSSTFLGMLRVIPALFTCAYRSLVRSLGPRNFSSVVVG
jgi:hypothetical protein